MNARIGCALTIIIGSIYAAAGLFSSLGDVAAGAIVAALGVIGIGLCDYNDSSDARLATVRDNVWARRDDEDTRRGL